MKHWVFDLDGTLIDSFGHYFKIHENIFNEVGLSFTEDMRKPSITEPLYQFFEGHLGKQALPKAFETLQVRSNEDAAQIQPFPGIMETLHHLSSNNSRIAVWTNRDLHSAQLILKHSGLSRYVEICISGTCAPRKPNIEGLLKIIDHFQCETTSVTMVGDHAHDVEAAKKVGANAIRASWHAYWEEEKCIGSDHQFYSTNDLHRFVGLKN